MPNATVVAEVSIECCPRPMTWAGLDLRLPGQADWTPAVNEFLKWFGIVADAIKGGQFDTVGYR